MNQDERLTRLIGNVYDAAVDPTLWISVLEEAARFVGGPAASLYSRDTDRKSGDVTHQSGLDPRFAQRYTEKYIKFDPTAIGYLMADIEEPLSTTDVMPYEQFIATRFYKEWGRPQGLVDAVHALLEKSATSAAAFIVFRHQRDGLVDNEARRRMRLVAPHIRRAVLLGKVLDSRKAEAATFGDALDDISAAIFFVERPAALSMRTRRHTRCSASPISCALPTVDWWSAIGTPTACWQMSSQTPVLVMSRSKENELPCH